MIDDYFYQTDDIPPIDVEQMRDLLENPPKWCGKEGCPHDLAGLVCNTQKNYGYVKENDCINPCRGSTSGITWQHRNFML